MCNVIVKRKEMTMTTVNQIPVIRTSNSFGPKVRRNASGAWERIKSNVSPENVVDNSFGFYDVKINSDNAYERVLQKPASTLRTSDCFGPKVEVNASGAYVRANTNVSSENVVDKSVGFCDVKINSDNAYERI